MAKYTIDQCEILELPKIKDDRGSLTFIESNRQIPFEIKRAYYLYDIPLGAERGGHAHKSLHQFMVAVSGSLDVSLDDGLSTKRVHLDQASYGLYIPPRMWRDINCFSEDVVCVVFASMYYDEEDYIRDYDQFLKFVLEK